MKSLEELLDAVVDAYQEEYIKGMAVYKSIETCHEDAVYAVTLSEFAFPGVYVDRRFNEFVAWRNANGVREEVRRAIPEVAPF